MANFVNPFEKWGRRRCRFWPSWHYSVHLIMTWHKHNYLTETSSDLVFTYLVRLLICKMVELKAKSSGNWKVDICPKYRKMQAYCAHFIVCCVWELAHSAVVCTEKNVVGMSSRKERQLRQHHGSCMYTVLRCTTALLCVLIISCLVGGWASP